MKKISKIIILFILFSFLTLPLFVYAGNPTTLMDRLKDVGEGDKGPYEPITADTDLPAIIGIVVGVFLSLLGIIFIVLILYAGYNWMTAAGDEQKVTKAKETIWRAIIGLIIVVSAYAIWLFIVKAFDIDIN